MRNAVKQISVLLGLIAFFLIIASGYNYSRAFILEENITLLLRALFGGMFFGFFGLIVGDIIIKGVIEDIDTEKLEPLEGGMEQRLYETKKKQKVSIVEKDVNFLKGKDSFPK